MKSGSSGRVMREELGPMSHCQDAPAPLACPLGHLVGQSTVKQPSHMENQVTILLTLKVSDLNGISRMASANLTAVASRAEQWLTNPVPSTSQWEQGIEMGGVLT